MHYRIERADQPTLERERLRAEARRLWEELMPLDEYLDALPLRALLSDFTTLTRKAESGELERRIRLVVKRVERLPQRQRSEDEHREGKHRIEFHLPRKTPNPTRRPQPFFGRCWLPGLEPLALQ
jgi:hypothetical protein